MREWYIEVVRYNEGIYLHHKLRMSISFIIVSQHASSVTFQRGLFLIFKITCVDTWVLSFQFHWFLR